MPFCTACGKQNPDDARFCSQCGTRLVARARAGRRPPAEPAGEATATITFGAPATRPRPPTGSSTRSTPPRSTRCPPGHALLVVQRGPGAGQPVPARHRRGHRRPPPRQRDLPRRRDRLAPARGVPPRAARTSPSATSAASTAPTSTATGSTRSSSTTATRCRSASTASSSSPGTRSALSRAAAPPASASGADEHRGGPRPAAPGLPGRHHPQDPVPRGQGPDQARADPGRLPQVLRRRRRAAALRPARCSATTTCRSR